MRAWNMQNKTKLHVTHCTRRTPKVIHTEWSTYFVRISAQDGETRRQMNVNVSFSHVQSIRHFIMLNWTFFDRVRNTQYAIHLPSLDMHKRTHLFNILRIHLFVIPILFSGAKQQTAIEQCGFHIMWTWMKQISDFFYLFQIGTSNKKKSSQDKCYKQGIR